MNLGLAITAGLPLWQGESVLDDTLGRRLLGYTHTISADVGFDTASIDVTAGVNYIESWLSSGIGRHIVARDHGNAIVFEGFVNSLSASIGSLDISIGPLLDVVTRCRVDYKTVTYNTDPPIGGEQATTGFANNTISQREYGTLEIIVSAGESREQQAKQIQEKYLSEWSVPETTERIELGGAGGSSMTLSVFGYKHLLGKFYVDRTIVNGTQDLSEKIKDALVQDPNGVVNTNYASIQDNSTQVGQYEDGTRTAETIISECVSYGDTGGRRYTFGIYENRLAVYKQTPSSIAYSISVKQPAQTVKDRAGQEIEYYNVRPGNWLWIEDILIGSGVIPNTIEGLVRDKRAAFIESVTFTAPKGLSISGGKVATLKQILNAKGLGNT